MSSFPLGIWNILVFQWQEVNEVKVKEMSIIETITAGICKSLWNFLELFHTVFLGKTLLFFFAVLFLVFFMAFSEVCWKSIVKNIKCAFFVCGNVINFWCVLGPWHVFFKKQHTLCMFFQAFVGIKKCL